MKLIMNKPHPGASRVALSALILLISLVGSAQVQAASYYVDNAVARSGDGTSWANAWKGFSNINWRAIEAGDTIHISGGLTGKTYNETLTVHASGAAGRAITITSGVDAGHDGPVVINGQNSRWWGIVIEQRANVTLSGLKVEGHLGAGVRARFNAGGVLVQDNDINTGNGRGIDARSNTGDVTIRANRITTPRSTSAQTDGMYFQENTGLIVVEDNDVDIINTNGGGHSDALQTHRNGSMVIRNNVFLSPTAGGHNHVLWTHAILNGHTVKIYNNLMISRGGQHNFTYWRQSDSEPNGTLHLWNNTIVGGRAVALERVPNSHVRNNIIWPGRGRTGIAVTVTSIPASNFGRNLVHAPDANVGYNPNGLTGDPMFIASDDYALQPSSPAIDAGETLAEVTTDIIGTPRPQGDGYDIGAFEFVQDAASSVYETIWGSATAPGGGSGTFYELGTIFSPTTDGIVEAIRVYGVEGESGTHNARIWSRANRTIIGGPYTISFSGPGWHVYTLPVPIQLNANAEYIVTVTNGTDVNRSFALIHGALTSSGSNGAHLTYPANAGVYSTVAGSMPATTYRSSNYLRDVVFYPAER